MKKYLLAICALMIITNNNAFADDSIAVVDLQKIVSNSSQVKLLKLERENKLKDLEKIIEQARNEISKTNDSSKILQLEDKYTKEFNNKKEALEKDYNTRLSNIEKNIKDEVGNQAKKEGYDIVIAKSVVLYGGNDITDKINIK